MARTLRHRFNSSNQCSKPFSFIVCPNTLHHQPQSSLSICLCPHPFSISIIFSIQTCARILRIVISKFLDLSENLEKQWSVVSSQWSVENLFLLTTDH